MILAYITIYIIVLFSFLVCGYIFKQIYDCCWFVSRLNLYPPINPGQDSAGEAKKRTKERMKGLKINKHSYSHIVPLVSSISYGMSHREWEGVYI